jgi:hypothetical protein
MIRRVSPYLSFIQGSLDEEQKEDVEVEGWDISLVNQFERI